MQTRRRVLLDTDVVLDLLLARDPFFPAAAELFLLIQQGDVEGYVSSLSFSNLFYILRKRVPRSEAVEILRKLRLLVRVLPVDESTVDRALISTFQDLEDALQAFAAEAGHMDAIATRNKRDFQASPVPVYSAEELIQLHHSQATPGEE